MGTPPAPQPSKCVIFLRMRHFSNDMREKLSRGVEKTTHVQRMRDFSNDMRKK